MLPRLALALACLAPALSARASEIELVWSPAPSGGEGDLRIERREPEGTWVEVGRLPLSATRFVDANLSRAATWCYRVRLARASQPAITHADETCVGPAADPAAPAGRRTRVRGGWLQEVEP